MKRKFVLMFSLFFCFILIACSSCNKTQAIELMGAGDRIHDSYTFANVGTKIKQDGDTFEIYGEVQKFENESAKKEFNIDSEITHVVAIKLTAIDCDVQKDKVTIQVDGLRSYDAEHLNGSDFTFIILEAIPNKTISIKVNWNGEDERTYIIKFSENLLLK